MCTDRVPGDGIGTHRRIPRFKAARTPAARARTRASRHELLSLCASHRIDGRVGNRKMSTQKHPLITSSPDVLGGTPVFAGTRVPVQTLIDYLEGGETIDDFLEGFPTVSREQVIAFLEEVKARMLTAAS